MARSSKAETREEQATRTRSALCAHARAVFVEKGYADASLSEIVRRAGVTKGALYHHFPDKLALYAAVVEDIEVELARRISSASLGYDSPWEKLEAVCHAYLDASLAVDVQRVLIIDAPVILGWKRWCKLENEYGFGALKSSLQEAADAGLLEGGDLEMLGQMIRGALNNAARVIVESPSPAAAREAVGSSIDRVLRGLRVGPAPS